MCGNPCASYIIRSLINLSRPGCDFFGAGHRRGGTRGDAIGHSRRPAQGLASTSQADSTAAATSPHQGGSPMDKAMHDKGLGVRRKVLGDDYVDAALKNVDDFNQPLQDVLNEYCWGAIWGREGLPLKTRSMLNLAMISILNRPHELRAHLRGALRNGVTKAEITEIFLQLGC